MRRIDISPRPSADAEELIGFAAEEQPTEKPAGGVTSGVHSRVGGCEEWAKFTGSE